MFDDRNREVASAWESFVTMIPTVGVLAGGLSNTGSLPCAVACAAAVEMSSAVAADATTTSPRTTSFRMRFLSVPWRRPRRPAGRTRRRVGADHHK
jgi:hypothetical protein